MFSSQSARIEAWKASVLWAMFAAFSLGGCATQDGPRKVALVIGNSKYSADFALTNPKNDLVDMCDALKRLGFEADCYPDVPSKEKFEEYVNVYFGKLGSNGVGVFAFSGHGIQSVGENYLVPTGVDLRPEVDKDLKDLYRMKDFFARARENAPKDAGAKGNSSAFQLVLLDACRSPSFSSFRNAEAHYGTAPNHIVPANTLVLYATASSKTAYDGEGKNGPLTKHFLSNVEDRGLTMEALMRNVTKGVEDETRRKFGEAQTPFVYGSLRNQFCFKECFDPNNFVVPPTN